MGQSFIAFVHCGLGSSFTFWSFCGRTACTCQVTKYRFLPAVSVAWMIRPSINGGTAWRAFPNLLFSATPAGLRETLETLA